MKRSSVILILEGAPRGRRWVLVNTARFRIGRAPDNDLVLDGPGVGDRHAVISSIFGAKFITDCGERGGTTLNGRRLAGKGQLRDGDLLGIGGERAIRVKLAAPLLARGMTLAVNSPALVLLASAGVVLVMTMFIVILSSGARTGEPESRGEESAAAKADAKPASPAARPSPSATAAASAPSKTPDEGEAATDGGGSDRTDQSRMEAAAVQVLRQVGRGPYSLDEGALEDISAKVEEYGESPQMGETLRQMSGGMQSVVARARDEGIEPSLVVYAALAQTDGGQSGRDPVAAARALLPELVKLSKTLGGVRADSNLIVLAAYTEGAGTRRSHPLLARVRQFVKRPLAERNVWYMYERGIINERAYDFVVSFLACGIIAQDPRRFGVDADALSL